ncbi:MAG: hypothetical protein ACOC0O_05230, partial [Spirochaetota bacterium]
RSAGRRTLSIVIGRRAAIVLVDVLVAASFLLVLAMTAPLESLFGFEPTLLPRLPVAGAPVAAIGALFAALILGRMHRRAYTHTTKHANMSSIIAVVALFTLTYALVLGLGIVLG